MCVSRQAGRCTRMRRTSFRASFARRSLVFPTNLIFECSISVCSKPCTAARLLDKLVGEFIEPLCISLAFISKFIRLNLVGALLMIRQSATHE